VQHFCDKDCGGGGSYMHGHLIFG